MDRVWQIGIVVRDLETATGRFMELFGLKERPPFNRVGREFGSEDCGTVYMGDTGSMASCMTCCFEFENIELEFIQPVGDAPSAWKQFLDEHGDGLHHLGWKVEDAKETEALFGSHGYKVVQSGSWGDGEYRYFDTERAFGFMIEVLKFYDE